jgi:hypothetical protein
MAEYGRVGTGAARALMPRTTLGQRSGNNAGNGSGCVIPGGMARKESAGKAPLLSRALNIGEAKKYKEYQKRVGVINAFEAEVEQDGRAARARRHRGVA